MPLSPRPAPTRRAVLTAGLVAATTTVLATTGAVTPAARAVPIPSRRPLWTPERTSVALWTPWGEVASANGGQARSGLSAVKILMADWIVRSGLAGPGELHDCELMVRASDDDAAQRMWDRFGPRTIDDTARAHGLGATWAGPTWGESWTSATDLVHVVRDLRLGDPASPVLAWMAQSDPIAADGTVQSWGTGLLADALGAKYGRSDHGPTTVASVSFGPGFVAAALTDGTAEAQTADVLGAFRQVPLGSLQGSVAGQPESTIDVVAAAFGSLVTAVGLLDR